MTGHFVYADMLSCDQCMMSNHFWYLILLLISNNICFLKDYPGLVKPDIIEGYRTQFLATFRAYTTGRYRSYAVLIVKMEL